MSAVSGSGVTDFMLDDGGMVFFSGRPLRIGMCGRFTGDGEEDQ